MRDPFRPPQIFVSYSRQDKEWADAAVELLRAGGASVFRDVDSIAYGDCWREVLEDAITRCERLVLLWSASASNSKSVNVEVRIASRLSKRIVPIAIDDTPLPRKLEQFQGLQLKKMVEQALRKDVPTLPNSPPSWLTTTWSNAKRRAAVAAVVCAMLVSDLFRREPPAGATVPGDQRIQLPSIESLGSIESSVTGRAFVDAILS